jgi:NADH:ubiquinone oxidoreductase subunit 6 (subunit J)
MDYIILILFAATIFLAFLSISAENRMGVILFMVSAIICLGILFIYIGAVYAGILTLLVYGGVLTVLFAATAYTLETRKVDMAKLEAGIR